MNSSPTHMSPTSLDREGKATGAQGRGLDWPQCLKLINQIKSSFSSLEDRSHRWVLWAGFFVSYSQIPALFLNNVSFFILIFTNELPLGKIPNSFLPFFSSHSQISFGQHFLFPPWASFAINCIFSPGVLYNCHIICYQWYYLPWI